MDFGLSKHDDSDDDYHDAATMMIIKMITDIMMIA
jgi:hypothetical protein